MNFNTYKLIYEIIEKKSNEFNYEIYDNDSSESASELFERMINNEPPLKPSQMDIYAHNVVNEIHSICINNKVNQNEITLPF